MQKLEDNNKNRGQHVDLFTRIILSKEFNID